MDDIQQRMGLVAAEAELRWVRGVARAYSPKHIWCVNSDGPPDSSVRAGRVWRRWSWHVIPGCIFCLDHTSPDFSRIAPEGTPTPLITKFMANGQNAVAGKGKGSEDTLIDSQVSTAQCKLAIDALLEHALAHRAAKEQSELLPDRTEQYIWLVVTVKKVFPERKVKPFKMCVRPSLPLCKPRI